MPPIPNGPPPAGLLPPGMMPPGGAPPMAGAPPMPGMGGPSFPSLDPLAISGAIGPMGEALDQMQAMDAAAFAAAQEEAAAAAMAELLRNRRNPAAEAAMSLPGPVDPLAGPAPAGVPGEVPL